MPFIGIPIVGGGVTIVNSRFCDIMYPVSTLGYQCDLHVIWLLRYHLFWLLRYHLF